MTELVFVRVLKVILLIVLELQLIPKDTWYMTNLWYRQSNSILYVLALKPQNTIVADNSNSIINIFQRK